MFEYTNDIWDLIWTFIIAGGVVFFVNLLLGGIAQLIYNAFWGDT